MQRLKSHRNVTFGLSVYFHVNGILSITDAVDS